MDILIKNAVRKIRGRSVALYTYLSLADFEALVLRNSARRRHILHKLLIGSPHPCSIKGRNPTSILKSTLA